MDFGTPPRERVEHLLLSTSHMIRLRDEKTMIQFSLINGETIEGTVTWFDPETYHVKQANQSEITLLKHSVLHFRTVLMP